MRPFYRGIKLINLLGECEMYVKGNVLTFIFGMFITLSLCMTQS